MAIRPETLTPDVPIVFCQCEVDGVVRHFLECLLAYLLVHLSLGVGRGNLDFTYLEKVTIIVHVGKLHSENSLSVCKQSRGHSFDMPKPVGNLIE